MSYQTNSNYIIHDVIGDYYVLEETLTDDSFCYSVTDSINDNLYTGCVINWFKDDSFIIDCKDRKGAYKLAECLNNVV